MKSFKEIREGYVSAAQRKAVWASRADGGKGKNETVMTSAERAREMQKKADAAKKKAQAQAAKAGYKTEGKDDYAKAMADYKAKGGKITKVAPGKAAGYHGKDDPGKGMAGMMDKGDTKGLPRKKVKSMGEAYVSSYHKELATSHEASARAHKSAAQSARQDLRAVSHHKKAAEHHLKAAEHFRSGNKNRGFDSARDAEISAYKATQHGNKHSKNAHADSRKLKYK